jgi:hypothetical protein
MEFGLEMQLKLIRWQYFCTLTFKNSRLGSARSRECDFWSWMRDWSWRESCELALLPIALRWERGDYGDRPHAHCLVAGLNRASISTCFRQLWRWNHKSGCSRKGCEGCGLGFAKVRLYEEREQSAEAYISKGMAELRLFDKNTYEIRRFDKADRLLITRAAWTQMLVAVGTSYAAQRVS